MKIQRFVPLLAVLALGLSAVVAEAGALRNLFGGRGRIGGCVPALTATFSVGACNIGLTFGGCSGGSCRVR